MTRATIQVAALVATLAGTGSTLLAQTTELTTPMPAPTPAPPGAPADQDLRLEPLQHALRLEQATLARHEARIQELRAQARHSGDEARLCELEGIERAVHRLHAQRVHELREKHAHLLMEQARLEIAVRHEQMQQHPHNLEQRIEAGHDRMVDRVEARHDRMVDRVEAHHDRVVDRMEARHEEGRERIQAAHLRAVQQAKIVAKHHQESMERSAREKACQGVRERELHSRADAARDRVMKGDQSRCQSAGGKPARKDAPPAPRATKKNASKKSR